MSSCVNGGRMEPASGTRTLRRYDWKASAYAPYLVPASWRVEKYLQSYEEPVNCAGCGKQLKWGETFTSAEIHDMAGLGYGICGECYDSELARKRAASKGAKR